MNVTCPECQLENGYHNGFNYECPDCDFEWSDDVDENNDNKRILDLQDDIESNKEILEDLENRLKVVLNNGSDIFTSAKLSELIAELKEETKNIKNEINHLRLK